MASKRTLGYFGYIHGQLHGSWNPKQRTMNSDSNNLLPLVVARHVHEENLTLLLHIGPDIFLTCMGRRSHVRGMLD